jgi:hypothetical protein
MMYSVWVQGWVEMGPAVQPAKLIGTVDAPSFPEACSKLLGSSPTFNAERLTDWGLALFSNESDANAAVKGLHA